MIATGCRAPRQPARSRASSSRRCATAGAVPATIAVVDGRARIGLDDAALDGAGARRRTSTKAGVRDLAPAIARGGVGATTVASTAHLAARRRDHASSRPAASAACTAARTRPSTSPPTSTTLARTGVTVVCAGVKSILDVGATLERLETLGVGVLGYRTDRFPGFYLADSGFAVGWRVEWPDEVASMLAARERVGLEHRGLVLANPIPPDEQLDPALHDRLLARRPGRRRPRRRPRQGRRRRTCSTASTARPAASRCGRTSPSSAPTRGSAARGRGGGAAG